MKGLLIGAVLALAGCAVRPVSRNPYVPPQAMYTTGSTLAAMGGVIATAAGAEMADPRHSLRTRQAGLGLLAAGVGLLGAALIDAIQVEGERRRLMDVDAAWRQHLMNRPFPEPFRPPPPPLPEVPFEFPGDESPLGGGPP